MSQPFSDFYKTRLNCQDLRLLRLHKVFQVSFCLSWFYSSVLLVNPRSAHSVICCAVCVLIFFRAAICVFIAFMTVNKNRRTVPVFHCVTFAEPCGFIRFFHFCGIVSFHCFPFQRTNIISSYWSTLISFTVFKISSLV